MNKVPSVDPLPREAERERGALITTFPTSPEASVHDMFMETQGLALTKETGHSTQVMLSGSLTSNSF